MKKLTTLLLTALLLSALPALAEMSLPYPESTVLSALNLTEKQQDLVSYLYGPLMQGSEKISLPKDTRYDDVTMAMTALMMDYPEMFHLGRHYSISYYRDAPELATAVTPRYRMDKQTADRMRGELYHEAEALLRRDPSALGLHDAVVERVTYGGDEELRHTAVGALLYGQATCEGYAQALCLLYRMAGFPCGVVSGEAFDSATGLYTSHSWNIANLSGPCLIDATWNDQQGLGLNTRWYFGLSTEQMGRDHRPGSDMHLPLCGDQANWHRAFGRYAATTEDFYGALRDLVRYGTPVNLRITDEALWHAVATDINGVLDDYNAWCAPEEGFYGAFSWTVSNEQRCIMIYRKQ